MNLLKGLKLTGACNDQYGYGYTANATLNVNTGARLNAAGGVQHGNLAVNLAGGSTLGAIGTADSTVTFTNNMTLGTAGAEGVITIDTAAAAADENLLLTRSADKGVTVDMTGNLSMQGNTAVEVIGSGTLKHKAAFNNATGIRVQEGAGLSVDSAAELSTATELNKGRLILNNAKVSGAVTVTDAASIHATGGESTLSGNTTLTNESTLTYGVESGAKLQSTGSLTADSACGSIIKQGGGALHLNNEANALANIRVDAGELSVYGAEAYDLNNLEAAASANLSFYTGIQSSPANEAEVRVSGAAHFSANVTLNANLTLTTGATLEVADGGLAMGSTLTLQEGLMLGDSTLSRIHSLTVGESTTLFSGVDGLTLGSTEYSFITTEDSILASPYFSNLTNNYILTYTGTDNGSLSITMMSASVPEPTTATLSLLALAALASRRRRK